MNIPEKLKASQTSLDAYKKSVDILKQSQDNIIGINAKLASSFQLLNGQQQASILVKIQSSNATDKQKNKEIEHLLALAKLDEQQKKYIRTTLNGISAKNLDADATRKQTDEIAKTLGTKQGSAAGMMWAMAAATTIISAMNTFSQSKQAQSVGEALGNSIGSGITTALSGAMMGFMVGGAPGAIIGGLSSLLVSGTSALIGYQAGTEQRTQELINSSKKLIDNYREQQKALDDNATSAKNLLEQYEYLSRGVDSNARNVSLTASEYDRYKSIVSELSSLYPQLTNRHNAEGVAVLSLTDSLNEMNSALDAVVKKSQELSDLRFISEDAGNIIKGYNESINRLNNDLEKIQSSGGRNSFSQGFFGLFNEKKQLEELIKLLDEYNIKYTQGSRRGGGDVPVYYWTVTVDENELGNATEKVQKQIEEKILLSSREYALIVEPYLRLNPDYQDFPSEIKDFIHAVASNLNFAELDIVNPQDIQDYLIRNIINPIVNLPSSEIETVQKFISNLFSLDSSELTAKDYAYQINDIIKGLSDIIPNVDIPGIMIKLGFDTVEFGNIANQAAEKLQEAFNFEELLETFTTEEIKIILRPDFEFEPEGNSLKEQIEEYLANGINQLGIPVRELSDALKETSAAMSLLSTAEKEMADNGEISLSTLQKVMETTDGWANCIDVSTGKILLNTEAVKQKMTATLQDEIAALKAARSAEISARAAIYEKQAIEGRTAESWAEIDAVQHKIDAKNDETDIRQALIDTINQEAEDEKKLTDIINAATSAASLYKTVHEEMAENGEISVGTLNKLIDSGLDYIDFLDTSAGKLEIQTAAFKEYILETIEAALRSSELAENQELLESVLNAVTDSMNTQSDILDRLNGELDNIQSAYQSVYKALEEYNELGYYSIDIFQELLKIHPRYLELLTDENGNLNLNREALNNLTKARIEELAQASARTLLETVSKFENEADALARLKTSVDNVTGSLIGLNAELLKTIRIDLGDEVADLVERQLRAIEQARDRALAGVGQPQSFGAGVKSAKETAKTISDLIKEATDLASLFSTVQQEMAESGEISVDTFNKLIGSGLDYAKLLDASTGKLVVNTDALRKNSIAKIEAILRSSELAENQELLEATIQAVIRSMDAQIDLISRFSESLNDIQSAYRSVHKALEEYNELGYYSIDIFQELLKIHPRYLELLTDENGELSLTEEKLNAVAKARIEELAQAQARTLLDTVLSFNSEAQALDHLRLRIEGVTGSLIELNAELLKTVRAQFGGDVVGLVERQLRAIEQARDRALAGVGQPQSFGVSVKEDKSSSESASKGSQRPLDLSNFYNEQLRDLERRLEPVDREIERIQSQIARAQALLGDNDLAASLTTNLVEAQEKRKAVLEEILSDTQTIFDKINSEFSEFSGVDMSDYGTAKFRRELSNQITAAQNAGADGNEAQIRSLEARLTRFNEYVSAYQAGLNQINGLQSQIDKASDELFKTYRQFLEEDYSRNARAIERRGNLLLPDDFEGQTRAALEKIENASRAINAALAHGYGEESPLMTGLADDLAAGWSAYSQAVISALELEYDKTNDIISLRKGLFELYAGENLSLRDRAEILEVINNLEDRAYQRAKNRIEHGVFLYGQNTGNAVGGAYNPQRVIEYYQTLQQKAHEAANTVRRELSEAGYDALSIENDPRIQRLQRDWWSYFDAVNNEITNRYDKWLAERRNSIEVLGFDKADKRDIIGQWQVVLQAVELELEQFSGKTDDYSKSRVEALTRDMRDIRQIISRTLDDIVKDATVSLDNINKLYTDLLNAAKEFADSGFITIEQFKSIIAHGIEYLHLLEDENGALVINEAAVKRVAAARTEQLAVETAMNYVYNIQQALQENNIETLDRLLYATETAADSTWDLVYANLELARSMGLTESEYDSAVRNLNNLRSLQVSVSSGIGQMTGQLRDIKTETEKSLNDLLKYVMDMIRWETKLRVDGIRDEIKAFEELIGLRRQELHEMQRKRDFEKDIARQTQSLARLQNQLAALERDNSGDPAIASRRRELAEQIAEMQGNIDDKIHDNYVETMEKAYDTELKEFILVKEQEIKIIEDTISSMEKLYRLAIDRISNNFDTLFSDLINYNYIAGNQIERDLVSAWDNASVAIQRYGSYLEALLQTQAQLNAMSSSTASSQQGVADRPTTVSNSNNFNATPSAAAQEQAKQDAARSIVDTMKMNSLNWHNADTSQQERLAAENIRLASQLQALIGRAVVRSEKSGVWYLDGVGSEELYKAAKFHTGGIVGSNPTIKENEVLSLLEKKEAVLTENQKDNMIDAIDTLKLVKLGIEDVLKVPKDSNINISDFFEQMKMPHLINSMLSDVTQGIANQAREIINNNNTSESIPIHIEKLEVPIIVKQKIDKSDIQALGQEIGEVAMGAIVEARQNHHGYNRDSTMQRISPY